MTELDINRPDAYEKLLSLQAMTTWTAARQREHAADAAAYEAALAAVQAGLRSQYVEGDRKWSATWRARKVEKHLRKMARAAREQERAAEALRTTYAAHVAHVAALPAQREAKRQAKELRKGGGRQAVGELAAKSLHKTGTTFAPAAPEPTADADGPAPTAGQVRGISDLWQRGA